VINSYKLLIEEHNVISLRRACVFEMDGIVSLQLLPAPSSVPAKHLDARPYHTFLYQHPTSNSERSTSGIKQLRFDEPPTFKLLWADSGNSVVVYLNGEAWAFIDEHTQLAYSKGILISKLGKPWDQFLNNAGNFWNEEVFDRTFSDVLD
jgi:hypothetical protein